MPKCGCRQRRWFQMLFQQRDNQGCDWEMPHMNQAAEISPCLPWEKGQHKKLSSADTSGRLNRSASNTSVGVSQSMSGLRIPSMISH